MIKKSLAVLVSIIGIPKKWLDIKIPVFFPTVSLKYLENQFS